jgi:peptide-methionine (S)-S-oxide reductase
MQPWRGSAMVMAIAAVVVLTSCGGGSVAATSKPGGKAAAAATKSKALSNVPPPNQAIATFAGGCFWCVESEFEKVPGVVSVISGFTGGPSLNPTYDEVSAGRTGHAESVRITYDPKVVTYTTLLQVFWHNIDPTQSNGQFCDHGKQYRSAIFYHDATQRELAEKSERAIAASGVLQQPIVTQIVPAGPFYAAEDYHQDFYKKDPERYHSYREGCGRDRRLKELWGKEAGVASR